MVRMDERIAKPSQWYEDLFTVELESGEVIKYSYDDMRTGKVYRELSDVRFCVEKWREMG